MRINGIQITSKYSFKRLFEKFDSLLSIDGDIDCLHNIFGDDSFSMDEMQKALNICFLHRSSRTATYLMNNGPKNMDENHLIRYEKWAMDNPKNRGDEYIKMMYIDDRKSMGIIEKRNARLKDKFSKYYTIDYWMSLGYDADESLKKIDEFKKSKATSKKGFINRHGIKKGEKLFEEWKSKCVNTIETFKYRYGDDWEVMWENYTKKDSSSMQWAIKKAHGNMELAKEIFDEKTSKTIITLNSLKKRHGVKIANEMWKDILKSRDSSSFDHMMKLCNGNEKMASELYKLRNSKKDSSSLNYFLKKFPHNPELALYEYNKKRTKSDCASMSFFLKKFDADECLAKAAYNEARIKRKVPHLRASKKSLEIFLPLNDELLSKGFISNDIFFGFESKTELFIEYSGDLFFYDFSILSKKKIIEFNGKAWHPNWEKYSDMDQIKKNFKYKTLTNIEEAVSREKKKIEIAKKMGFDVLVLWEEDGVDFNKKKAEQFILNKNENQKH